MDRYFDMHVRACWSRAGKKGAAYPKWLATQTAPIYMQDHYPEVPASVKYPKGQILAEFSYAHRRNYFCNQAAWMIALAITEGVTHIGLFGINYGTEGEYFTQRGSAEYWLGQLDGRGITVILPEQCTLLREPALLYGYESHHEQTGELKREYKPRVWKDTKIPVVPGGQNPAPFKFPPEIQAAMEAERRENPRPDWTLRPLCDRSDGEAYA